MPKTPAENPPVDSEHSALMQCMTHPQAVSRLILTASGGPFFGKTRAETANVTPEQALGHPTEDGPARDNHSSTLMNKGFEVIEAPVYDIFSRQDR